MRIWFPALRAGSGSDVYVERLSAALCKRGVDVVVDWFDRRFELCPDLLRYVRAPVGTDVIHVNSWNGFAFARKGIPLVVNAFHCVYRIGYPGWKTSAQAFYHDHWIGRLERRTFARASAVVAMTESAAKDFKERFDLPNPNLIHGWVDVDTFRPGEGEASEDDVFQILIVGNSSLRKGEDLLPALRNRLGSRYRITVVGGLRANWQNSCPGIVLKSGLSQEALVEEYQRADVVVSLSRYEGFGYTALEGMACAKPVVAFDVAGLRDIVSHDRTGFLLPLEDVAGIAESCERLARDPSLVVGMGRAGRASATSFFSEGRALTKYIDLYESLGC
jgi:glycosyltransferase involved in cell wall biosynthesis